MILTKLQKKQYKHQIIKLWKQCFNDTQSYMDFYFTWKWSYNTVYAILENDNIVSMIHLNPYKLWIKDKVQTIYYIVGVATEPGFRKRGLMRLLLQQILNDLYEAGHPFTYLMPAKKEIYLPFDFCFIYHQFGYTSSSLMAASMEPVLSCKPLSMSMQKEINSLCEMVNQMLYKKFTIFALHTRNYLEELICEMESSKGKVLVFYKDNILLGYSAYMLEEEKAEIVETVVIQDYSSEIRESLENYIIQNNKNISISFHYLESAWMNSAFLDEKETVHPCIMARVLHPEYFLSELLIEEENDIIIKLTDNLIQSNNGVYEVFEKYDKKVWKSTSKKATKEITISEITEQVFKGHCVYLNEIV